MFFSPKKLLLGATLLLSPFLAAADDCSEGPWTDVSSTGGGGGGGFCATKWKSGVVITGVEAWANDKGVRAIQFYYSDGSNSNLYGKIDGDRHAKMEWDPAVDTIDQVRTWGNGRGENLGRVQIRTTQGKELDVGKDTNGQDTFESKVASGILLGAFGASGDLIDSLGFIFLKSKIERISIDDVVFKETPEELNKRMEGLTTVILDYADHTNVSFVSSYLLPILTQFRTTPKPTKPLHLANPKPALPARSSRTLQLTPLAGLTLLNFPERSWISEPLLPRP